MEFHGIEMLNDVEFKWHKWFISGEFRGMPNGDGPQEVGTACCVACCLTLQGICTRFVHVVGWSLHVQTWGWVKTLSPW